MYKYTYQDLETGRTIYSNVELKEKHLKLISGVHTKEINPETKQAKEDVKLK